MMQKKKPMTAERHALLLNVAVNAVNHAITSETMSANEFTERVSKALAAHKCTLAEAKIIMPVAMEVIAGVFSDLQQTEVGEMAYDPQSDLAVDNVTMIITTEDDEYVARTHPEALPSVEPEGYYSSFTYFIPGSINSILFHLYWADGEPSDDDRIELEKRLMASVQIIRKGAVQ